jgi:hypothetical protein
MSTLSKTRKRPPTPTVEEAVTPTVVPAVEAVQTVEAVAPVVISNVTPIGPNGTFLGSLTNQSSQFQTFLTSHANDAYTRPWHRLERGVRLNRLRLFAHEERARCALSDADQQALFLVLTKALEKKQLNSKTIVTYDTEQQKILEIKGLVSHKHADGRTIYQFLERKAGITSKRKPVDPPATASSASASST